MPVFKAVNKSYWKGEDLRNLIHYAVTGEGGRMNVCGAQGILLGDADSMYQQMAVIKEFYRKERNRQCLHYILSFSEEEEKYIGIREALQIGYGVAACFLGWQVVFGIHENTDNLHIHFVVNGTSYENGKAYEMSWKGLEEMKKYIGVMVRHFCVSNMPEEKRKEFVCRKAGTMAEIF